MTAEETIRRAAKMDEFLKDAIVDEQFKEVAVRYYQEFRVATSSELRVQAWAKANALEDVMTQLRTVIGAGEIAVLTAAKAVASRPAGA